MPPSDPLFVVTPSRSQTTPDHDVAQCEGVFSRDGEFSAQRVGRQRIEQHEPAAVGPRRRLAFLPGKRDRDFFSRLSPAPNRERLVTLQHGAIGEQRRERDLGAQPGGRKQQREDDEGKAET